MLYVLYGVCKWCVECSTYRLEAENVRVQRAVLDEPDASCGGRHVPADLAGALRAQIERHNEPSIVRVLLQRTEHTAGLCDEHSRGLVELEHRVHQTRREYHFLVNRNAAADLRGVAALHDDGQPMRVAVLHYGTHLCHRPRLHCHSARTCIQCDAKCECEVRCQVKSITDS